ncbi:hypothetical protein [Roseivirga misakiensis]|uniref:GTP-binding protein n=1 Tax=Roseivirga misakiensis TaxID=1563681 RepID=A0A1E5T6P6_9BACT|nr:hypothetical protein [Roseivirga misakiensis]OEK07016.1 hypothetical protein BFP71_04990 [Roseivirga misakiensis]
MSNLTIRPRFKEELKLSAVAYKELIQKMVDQTDSFSGLVSQRYCVIKISPDKRHFWSPQLTLSIEEKREELLEVRGLYGPKPSVWAIFFMSYAALGLLTLFVGIYGMSLTMLGKPSQILWAIPIMIGIAVLLYFVSRAGRKMGNEQILEIHDFYQGITQHKVALT